jgi:uncharacterized protein
MRWTTSFEKNVRAPIPPASPKCVPLQKDRLAGRAAGSLRTFLERLGRARPARSAYDQATTTFWLWQFGGIIGAHLFDSPPMPKPRRIRDPVHDLINFGTDRFEQMAWGLLEAPEFQRLRRIKQLGFSELVFPGATHSRFAHSVGVFHTARQLALLIENRLGERHVRERAQVAMAAALVHDLGHGPFSHAFETAAKSFSEKKGHEDWTTEIILGETTIRHRLEGFRSGFSTEVADVIAAETPADIYASIVSSQFDADRLDYIRRDRLMAGVLHGGFDFSWLMANLEVGRIPFTLDDERIGEVEALILNQKALQAAESYVLGLFHLYFTVYFHKATRSAEKMLTALLTRVASFVKNGQVGDVNLPPNHPLVAFIISGSLSDYLWLDDYVIWSALRDLMEGRDEAIKKLASRLLSRRLYKAIDVGTILEGRGGEAALAQFRLLLRQAKEADEFAETDLFEDATSRNPYKRKGLETPEALSKVLIRRPDGSGFMDLRDSSQVVRALEEKRIFRV